ncbi:hypothetical protein [Halocatena salina]|uniref:Uncharacterized protein n=1 Tax=Halocatena salina TaxID=2934340 RepID=A0A8U0A833_9EURY|nr:hypothetical protein [Halocatena salina]UPM44999.1 hypothetical protein MW046_18250 [Halocatena salina]
MAAKAERRPRDCRSIVRRCESHRKTLITFGQERGNYPTATEERYSGVDRGNGFPVAEYSERVVVGYRHFDEQDIEPLFAFGMGYVHVIRTSRSASDLK